VPSYWTPAGRARRGARRTVQFSTLLVFLAAACATPGPSPPLRCDPERVTLMSVPYWNLADGAAKVGAHARTLTGTSPWVYGVRPDGEISPHLSNPSAEDTKNLESIYASGLTTIPTVANHFDGGWQYAPIARMLHDPAVMRNHIEDLTALAVSQNFAGIDIDYEELRGVDRTAFTEFVTRLGEALHSKGKQLAVTVSAKTSDAGNSEPNRAQDYGAIARAADEVRVMAYDYRWETSEPGPIAPGFWVRDVLAYATTQIEPDKIVLGVPVYGYDWSVGVAPPVSWARAHELSQQHNAEVQWDAQSETPWFRYWEGDSEHTVWFENAYSSAVKFQLAREFGVRGVYLWVFGPEDQLLWKKLNEDWKMLPCPGPPPPR
jgi:spore germination protein